MRSILAFTVSVVSLLAAISCSGPTEEEKAVARLRNLQKSGFVRVVNLTESDTNFVVGGKQLMAKIEPDKGSVFLATPAGSVKVESSQLSEPVQFELAAKANASVYLVSGAGGVESHTVANEPRLIPENKAVVTVVCADPSAKYAFKPESGAEVALEAFKPTTPIEAAGDFKASITTAGGIDIPVQIATQDHGAYTIVVYKKGGKPTVLVLNNHPDMNVTAMGAAAG